MKTKSIILSVLMLMTFAGLSARPKKDVNKQTVTFNVPMHCMSCQNKIEKNIAFEKGVKDMEVDLEAKTVKVTFDNQKTNVEKLITAFKKLGYDATLPDCCAEKAGTVCPQGKGGACHGQAPANCPAMEAGK